MNSFIVRVFEFVMTIIAWPLMAVRHQNGLLRGIGVLLLLPSIVAVSVMYVTTLFLMLLTEAISAAWKGPK